MSGFFDTKIEFLKGVGPQRAALLNKELRIFKYGDLIEHYPFRYEDRTRIYKINEIMPDMTHILVKGKITAVEKIGGPRKQRLVAYFEDDTGQIELTWFRGVKWMLNYLKSNVEYLVFGKPNIYSGRISVPHPEMEVFNPDENKSGYLQPVYNVSELLKRKYIDSRAIVKMQQQLLKLAVNQIHETLPPHVTDRMALLPKKTAIINIHFPKNQKVLEKARFRLKFEELFYVQLRLLKQKNTQKKDFKGLPIQKIPSVHQFYKDHLPFELTNAQKRVIKEIHADMKSGKQMNRLLQGDVGSGKTIVAFLTMLMAIDNDAQACMMAPTEILADQHYQGLKEYADLLGIGIAKLTGSSKKSERTPIHEGLMDGSIKIIIGTHALLEDNVQFKNLAVCVIDEQHRFGVAQRAKLWRKNKNVYPHVLVMTATPIPRTLAMTLYGDLDVSVIDELPPGRKPIKTTHRFDGSRLKVFGFIKEQIAQGRQVYIVYPLIEESAKMDYKNLMDGYESICRAFPKLPVSIVHGRMKATDKDFEMQRFVKGETKIMVATTVIEVGVNVPNASVMVIENAERFGLAQLHQLRGRVGRGADQSYCILMTGNKLSSEGRLRMETMVRTNNGFEIADVDLQLRGPGDLMGTQQSGVLDLLIADLAQDGRILQEARIAAQTLLEDDPDISKKENENVRRQLNSVNKNQFNWGRIS